MWRIRTGAFERSIGRIRTGETGKGQKSRLRYRNKLRQVEKKFEMISAVPHNIDLLSPLCRSSTAQRAYSDLCRRDFTMQWPSEDLLILDQQLVEGRYVSLNTLSQGFSCSSDRIRTLPKYADMQLRPCIYTRHLTTIQKRMKPRLLFPLAFASLFFCPIPQ